VSIIAHKKRRPRKSECHEELGPFTQARRRIRFSPKRMEREGTGKENEEEQAGSDESTPSGKDEQAADQEHEEPNTMKKSEKQIRPARCIQGHSVQASSGIHVSAELIPLPGRSDRRLPKREVDWRSRQAGCWLTSPQGGRGDAPPGRRFYSLSGTVAVTVVFR
jgi:hypothetical protein